MKLTLHLVAKDLRRLRGWLLCWLIVLALPVLNGVLLITRSPLPLPDSDWNLPNVHRTLVAIEGVVAFLIALLLVHEDSLLGTRPFWLTRPISGARLFAAKIGVAVIVFGLMPALVSLPWWLWCGFDLLQIAGAVRDFSVVLALIVVPAALLAVITDTLARALLWSSVLGAFVIAAVVLFFFVFRDNPSGELALRAALGEIVILSAAILVIASRYLLRRQWWPIAVVMVVMVGALAFLGAMPPPLLDKQPEEFNADRAAAIRIEHRRTTIGERVYPTIRMTKVGPRERIQPVRTTLLVSGVPEDRTLRGLTGSQTWRFADLVRTERSLTIGGTEVRLGGLHWPTPDAETQAWWQEQRAAREARSPSRPAQSVSIEEPKLGPSERLITAYTMMPPSIATRLGAEQPPYEADLWLILAEPKIPCEQPLASGRWMARRGYGLRVDHVDRVPKQRGTTEVTATVVSTRPALWSGFHSEAWRDALRWTGPSGLIQINRSREEYMTLPRGEPLVLVVNGVEISWHVLTLYPERIIRSGKWVERPTWFEQTTLGIVVLEPEAVFHRHLSVEKPAAFWPENSSAAPAR